MPSRGSSSSCLRASRGCAPGYITWTPSHTPAECRMMSLKWTKRMLASLVAVFFQGETFSIFWLKHKKYTFDIVMGILMAFPDYLPLLGPIPIHSGCHTRNTICGLTERNTTLPWPILSKYLDLVQQWGEKNTDNSCFILSLSKQEFIIVSR